MAKGENIFRRRDGRWEARYIKGRELSGKIKYGYCYGKTYREAKEKAAKRKAALANGAPLPTARTQKPFSSYCLEWLHTKKCTVKESTYIKYSAAVNKHIIPKLGVCHPLGFTTELMDDFIKELQFEDELAPKTVHDILVVLHGILKFASSKFAGSFPAVEINYPKIGKKEMRVLSREEQARLVAYAHTREECEEKLKVLIVEMKAELAELKRQKAEGTLPLQEIEKDKKKDRKKAR